MVYDTFLNTVKEQMEQALGDGYSLTLRKVQKNNGLILDGLCIAKGNGTIAPSIYLNSCYEQYLNGTSMEEIIQKLLTAYYESSWPPICAFSPAILPVGSTVIDGLPSGLVCPYKTYCSAARCIAASCAF